MSGTVCIGAVGVFGTIGLTGSVALASGTITTIEMGMVDGLAIDQPRVAVSFLGPVTGNRYPEDVGSGFTMLLDTGASGYLLAKGAHFDLFGSIFGGGDGELVYPIAGQYDEQGVGGFERMNVSTPINATVSSFFGISDVLGDLFGTPEGGGSGSAGTGNVPTIEREGIKALLAPTLDIGSYDGIIGMPGMVGHAVVINLAAMTGAQVDMGMFGSLDLFDYIHVGYATEQHVTDRLAAFDPVDVFSFDFSRFTFDHAMGQVGPDGPIPNHEDLPLLSGVGMGSGDAFHQGTYLFDTGAQISMISSDVARALGMNPYDPDHETLVVGGVGGQLEIPIVLVPTFTLDTRPDDHGDITRLAFDNIVVGIIDIPGLPVDGILGFNPFTTGYLAPILAALGGEQSNLLGAKGAFLELVFDFTDDDAWQMHAVRNAAYTGHNPFVIGGLDDLDGLSLLENDEFAAIVGLLALLDPNFDPDNVNLSLGTGLDGLALFAWPAGLVIPEPTTATLLAAGTGLLLWRRRR
jgi:hypothetical protein